VTGLRAFGGAAIPPADIADLTCRIGRDLRHDLPGLIAKLSPSPQPLSNISVEVLVPDCWSFAFAGLC
jgi:hypothetical protein